jgi:glycine C-acetyltransferase
MNTPLSFQQHLCPATRRIRSAGLYKGERVLSTPQGTRVRVLDGTPVLNLCANNYLGLAQHPAIREAGGA